MITYVASDLDGTILQNKAEFPSQEMYDLILRLKEKNIHFIAASGRQYQNLRLLFEPIQDEISYVAENGSLCVHNGKVIAKGLIERELGLRIIDTFREYGDCHPLLSCESRCYTESKDPKFVDHIRNVVRYDIEVVDDLHQIQEPFLKLAACDTKGTSRMEAFFKERFQDEIKCVTSGNIWVDFVAPNANKGTSLAKLLQHLGLRPEDGIAFGDQYNDVEMLQLAGTSYAMSNAAPGIAYYTTYVTDSVEEVLRDIVAGV